MTIKEFGTRQHVSTSRLAVVTWHGSTMVDEPAREWIVHRRVQDVEASDIIYLDGSASERWTSPLFRSVNRPRALPVFAVDPVGQGWHTLQCIRSGTTGNDVDRYLSAINNGTFEINRYEAAGWERFLLLDNIRHAWLVRLLRHGRIAAAGGEELPIALEEGLVLVSGSHRIDLPAALAASSESEPDRLMTSTGAAVSISHIEQ